jgi:hypothetical protein
MTPDMALQTHTLSCPSQPWCERLTLNIVAIYVGEKSSPVAA